MVWSVTISYEDEKGRTSRQKLFFPSPTTQPELEAFMQDYLTQSTALTWGAITNVSLTVDLTSRFTGLRNTPAPNSDVEEKLKFSYKNAAGKTTVITLPTINPDMTAPLLGSKKRIADFLQPEVSAFHTLLSLPGNYGHSRSVSDNRGAEIIKLTRTRATWISSRKV